MKGRKTLQKNIKQTSVGKEEDYRKTQKQAKAGNREAQKEGNILLRYETERTANQAGKQNEKQETERKNNGNIRKKSFGVNRRGGGGRGRDSCNKN
jgi:hypothetical protein